MNFLTSPLFLRLFLAQANGPLLNHLISSGESRKGCQFAQGSETLGQPVEPGTDSGFTLQMASPN